MATETLKQVDRSQAAMPSGGVKSIAAFLVGSVLFGTTYTQAPLYYSNQNQYFLQGLAHADVGFLQDDWLANTHDPTPVFSLLVELTQRYLNPLAFHVFYFVLFGIYLAGMVGLFKFLARQNVRPRLLLGFLAILFLVHSAVMRWSSYRWLGLDYPWYFQSGVAGQYILGAMFQPSTFGVLLIPAILLYVTDKPYLAVACCCLTATAHSTYLPSAAMLTLAFMIDQAVRQQFLKALLLGFVALALELPVATYVAMTFRPTSAEIFAEAQRILVHQRIPHHSLPQLWISDPLRDPVPVLQIVWIVVSLILVRKTRLFPVLALVLFLSIVLTMVQVATESDNLALLFPWRTSAFLVPIATTIIITKFVTACAGWVDTSAAALVNAGIIGGVTLAGFVILAAGLGYQTPDEEVPLMEFVRDNRRPNEVYLLPVQVPNLKATTRGSLSSDFKALAAKKKDSRIVPLDFQRFRLYTGAPIFVDFKAIPYKDTDVLAWYQRLQINQKLVARLKAGDVITALAEMRQLGITHFVVPVDQKLSGAGVQVVYQDRSYRICRVLPAAKQ